MWRQEAERTSVVSTSPPHDRKNSAARTRGPTALAAPRLEREPQAEPDLPRHLELRTSDNMRDRLPGVGIGALETRELHPPVVIQGRLRVEHVEDVGGEGHAFRAQLDL